MNKGQAGGAVSGRRAGGQCLGMALRAPLRLGEKKVARMGAHEALRLADDAYG
jgi:hypothetical protein